MDSSMTASRLTPLQRDLLDAFFRHEQEFFLTGGAALAGFYLCHRVTHDLDLFSTSNRLDSADAALRQAADELGGTIEMIHSAPEFRRRLVRRGDESVVVDLVFDRTPQAVAQKSRHGAIRLDPPQEILANKLCALLARAEIRDLVDVRALEDAGFAVEAALVAAAQKDAGLTPAQLAWVLSQIEIPDDAVLPGDVAPAELQTYLSNLMSRLTRLAFPT